MNDRAAPDPVGARQVYIADSQGVNVGDGPQINLFLRPPPPGPVVAGNVPQTPHAFQPREDLMIQLRAAGPGVSVVRADSTETLALRIPIPSQFVWSSRAPVGHQVVGAAGHRHDVRRSSRGVAARQLQHDDDRFPRRPDRRPRYPDEHVRVVAQDFAYLRSFSCSRSVRTPLKRTPLQRSVS